MKHILAVLALPFSIGGALAIVMSFYAKTSDAQRATSELIISLSQLSFTIPKLIIYLGLLSLMIAGAYAIINFANSGARRVNMNTEVKRVELTDRVRLTGSGTIVGKKALASGYDVMEGVYVETNHGHSAGVAGEHRGEVG